MNDGQTSHLLIRLRLEFYHQDSDQWRTKIKWKWHGTVHLHIMDRLCVSVCLSPAPSVCTDAARPYCWPPWGSTVWTRNSVNQSTDPENSSLEPNMEWIRWSTAEISPSEFCKMAAKPHHLGFHWIRISAIRSTDPENPNYNQTWSGLDASSARYLPLNYIVTLKLEIFH